MLHLQHAKAMVFSRPPQSQISFVLAESNLEDKIDLWMFLKDFETAEEQGKPQATEMKEGLVLKP